MSEIVMVFSEQFRAGRKLRLSGKPWISWYVKRICFYDEATTDYCKVPAMTNWLNPTPVVETAETAGYWTAGVCLVLFQALVARVVKPRDLQR